MINGSKVAVERRISALVVNDNVVVRVGLTSLLEASGRVTVAGEAADGSQAAELAENCRPDVALLDVRVPGRDGLQALPKLVTLTRVLMVTYNGDRAVIDRALRIGATGYLVYGQFTPAELVDAVVGAASGLPYLSPVAVAALVDSLKAAPQGQAASPRPVAHGLSHREMEIMEHIVRGRGNAHIARMLYLSEKTVKNHINHIYAKLGTRNRAEAIAFWLGLAEPAERGQTAERGQAIERGQMAQRGSVKG
jgi:DNA-binding NarL/FixJ family response regulator